MPAVPFFPYTASSPGRVQRDWRSKISASTSIPCTIVALRLAAVFICTPLAALAESDATVAMPAEGSSAAGASVAGTPGES
eukprot:2615597-Prymnesium_polylepis.1